MPLTAFAGGAPYYLKVESAIVISAAPSSSGKVWCRQRAKWRVGWDGVGEGGAGWDDNSS
jgi:hypothetical protein